jgi:hypothetical protein
MDTEDELIGHPLGDAASITQKDIWDAAMAFIERYGDVEAVIEAGKRSDEFLAAGDLAGQRTWLRVVHAISDLMNADEQGKH